MPECFSRVSRKLGENFRQEGGGYNRKSLRGRTGVLTGRGESRIFTFLPFLFPSFWPRLGEGSAVPQAVRGANFGDNHPSYTTPVHVRYHQSSTNSYGLLLGQSLGSRFFNESMMFSTPGASPKLKYAK